MPNSYFIYNGIDCNVWHCSKTQPINFPSPVRDIETVEVPGRNGELIIDHGRYSNVEVVVECLIDDDNFIADFDAMRAELLKDSEYHVLKDSLYPEEYRLASVRTIEAKIKTPPKGTVEITFSCKPQRYLESGDHPAITLDTTAGTMPTITCGIADSIFNSTVVNAIRGRNYEPGMRREELYDAEACSRYMKTKFQAIGRGAVCGICMRHCPKRGRK